MKHTKYSINNKGKSYRQNFSFSGGEFAPRFLMQQTAKSKQSVKETVKNQEVAEPDSSSSESKPQPTFKENLKAVAMGISLIIGLGIFVELFGRIERMSWFQLITLFAAIFILATIASILYPLVISFIALVPKNNLANSSKKLDQKVSKEVTNTDQESLEKPALQNGKLFDSNLAVDEYLLLKQMGFQPLGLAVGTVNFVEPPIVDVYDPGQWLDGALTTALSRMTQSATNMGADGVVSVSINTGQVLEYENSFYLTVFGTAVTVKNKSLYKREDEKPFTTNLSAKDLWALVEAGYTVLGLLYGGSYVSASVKDWRSVVSDSKEIQDFTYAFYEARDSAMIKLQQRGLNLDAEGIIGVTFLEHYGSDWEESKEEITIWDKLNITMFVLGTAVKKVAVERATKPSEITYDLA